MINVNNYDFKDFIPTTYKSGTELINGKKEPIYYCDNIFTLDLETTSYYIKDGIASSFDYSKDAKYYDTTTPQGLMYIWMFGIDKQVIYGRTYEELAQFMIKLSQHINSKYFVYIHNLSFDFQFILNALGTNCEIFARKERKPMKVFYEHLNCDFRCSYFLTNKTLAKAVKDSGAPEEYHKMIDDLDYNIIRTPLTTLTEKELGYCKNDILGLYYVIEEKHKSYNRIKDIPLTQTGQVRKKLKKTLWNESKYIKQVHQTWPDFEQFSLLNDCFYGGYVHANHKYSNKILRNVYSYDITSSYPHVLCTKKYPTKAFTESLNKDLNFLDFENYAYMIDITLTDIKAKIDNSFLSLDKSKSMVEDFDGTPITNKKIISDNGRIRSADKLRYKLTDCDLLILNDSYSFKYTINKIWTAPKDYLPEKLINFILQLFGDKTKYKDVEGMESKYKEAKEYVNAIYGMFVTKILSDEITFENGEWSKDLLIEEVADEKLLKMSEDRQFTSFSTGVWCAAYARKHLWDMIILMDKDVIYCDTDSIKFFNKDNIKYFELDNHKVNIDIMNVCFSRNLDPNDFKVLSPDGSLACLGYFEKEPTMTQFRTLGAKKYAYIIEDSNEVIITVAGVNKKTGKKRFKNLNQFKPGTFLDYDYAGKNMVRYNDNQEPFTFEDGWTAKDKRAIVLTPTTYLLNITSDYSMLLDDLEDSNYNTGEGTHLL